MSSKNRTSFRSSSVQTLRMEARLLFTNKEIELKFQHMQSGYMCLTSKDFQIFLPEINWSKEQSFLLT